MSYRGDIDIGLEFEAVETLVEERATLAEVAPTGPTGLGARGFAQGLGARGFAHLAADDHFPATDVASTPPGVVLRAAFWRSARTRAPIVAADVLALTTAGILTQALLSVVYPPAAQSVGWLLSAFCLLPLILAYTLTGLYSEVWAHVVVELRQLTNVTTIWLLAAGVAGILAWPLPIWCAVAWPAAVALVPMMRTVAHLACQHRPWWGYPTLVIGSGAGAETIVQALLAAPRCGLRPVLLTDPQGSRLKSVLPVVNDPTSLESIMRAEVIRHAVVSLPDLSHRRLREALDRYSDFIPHLLVLSECSTLPTLWSASRNGGRLSGIEVRNGLLLATLQGLKRAIDLLIAATVLLLVAPLLPLVVALVKLSSPGPVFYGHTRIGRHGRLFTVWKFRTMRLDGDTILRHLLARDPVARAEWNREQKLRNDPRVTQIGALLRKTSIDELPQLWNVLKGHMSLVGPRPIGESEMRRYGNVLRLYTTVKPGITGLWQVSGRNNIGYDERVQLDEFYIRHWSLWLDVYIVAKTVVALLSRRGAY